MKELKKEKMREGRKGKAANHVESLHDQEREKKLQEWTRKHIHSHQKITPQIEHDFYKRITISYIMIALISRKMIEGE